MGGRQETGVASQVPMKPAHELGLLNLAKFNFHYNIIWAMSSLVGKTVKIVSAGP